jgi:hypothetical protein
VKLISPATSLIRVAAAREFTAGRLGVDDPRGLPKCPHVGPGGAWKARPAPDLGLLAKQWSGCWSGAAAAVTVVVVRGVPWWGVVVVSCLPARAGPRPGPVPGLNRSGARPAVDA